VNFFKKYLCNKCDKKFSKEEELIDCKECKKEFSNMEDMRTHLQKEHSYKKDR